MEYIYELKEPSITTSHGPGLSTHSLCAFMPAFDSGGLA